MEQLGVFRTLGAPQGGEGVSPVFTGVINIVMIFLYSKQSSLKASEDTESAETAHWQRQQCLEGTPKGLRHTHMHVHK